MRHKSPHPFTLLFFYVAPATCIRPANSLRGKELVLVVTGIISNEIRGFIQFHYGCMAPCICIRKCHRKLLLPQGVHTLGVDGHCFRSQTLHLLLEQCSSTPLITTSWQFNGGTINYLSIHRYHYPNVVAVQRVDMCAPGNRILLPE